MPRRSPLTVLAAWLVTGPAGHLWGWVADLAELLWRYGRGRISRSP